VSARGSTTDWNRWAGYSLGSLTLALTGCLVWAAFLYPGGTWCEPQHPGYDLVRSFLCDPLHTHGLNGAPNPAAGWARAGLLLSGLAFVPFWAAMPRALGFGGTRATAVRVLGVSSALLSLVVASTPSDVWPAVHTAAVLSASATGVAAAIVALSAPSRSSAGRTLRAVGWTAMSAAAADAALYAEQALFPKPCAMLLPALQKVAALWIVAWMLGTAWVLLRGAAENRGVTETDAPRTR